MADCFKNIYSPNSTSAIPPLERNGLVYSDKVEKANIFNDYLRDQTLLAEDNVSLPAIDNYIINEPLSSLVFTTDEVKAASELSTPLATL